MPRTSSSSGRSSTASYGKYGGNSSGSSSSGYNSSSTTITTPKQSIPRPSQSKPSKQSPPQHPSPSPTVSSNKTELGNKSSGGGFMSTAMEGFSFGVGSSIAHRLVGGIYGSPSSYSQSNPQTTKVETYQHHHYPLKTPDISKPEYIPKPECKSLHEDYLKCIQSSSTDFQSSCDFSLNMFKDCETEHKTFN